MTLTTTQLAGMSAEQLIEMASTDFERELVRRWSVTLDAYEEAEDDRAQPVDTNDARDDLDNFESALEKARMAHARLKTFIESL